MLAMRYSNAVNILSWVHGRLDIQVRNDILILFSCILHTLHNLCSLGILSCLPISISNRCETNLNAVMCFLNVSFDNIWRYFSIINDFLYLVYESSFDIELIEVFHFCIYWSRTRCLIVEKRGVISNWLSQRLFRSKLFSSLFISEAHDLTCGLLIVWWYSQL